MTVQSDLTKLTVNLTPTSVATLNASAERLGDTRADTVNRALQWYDHSTRDLFRWQVRWMLIFCGWMVPVFIADSLLDPPVWLAAALAVVWAVPGLFVASRLNWRPR